MTGSEDHRGSYALLIVSEVSHARIAIIADRLVVGRTGRTPPAGVDCRPTRGTGPGTRSTRSPRYLRRIVPTGTPEGVAVLEASLTRP